MLKYGFETSCLRQTFIAPVFIKIILMSLNEHCLYLLNCLLGSLFIYVYLAFKKLPTSISCISLRRLFIILKVTVSPDRSYTLQCGKRPLANSPKASGNFGWRVRSTLYSLVWRVTVVRRVGT